MPVLARSPAFRLLDGSACRVVLADAESDRFGRAWVVTTLIASPQGSTRVASTKMFEGADPALSHARAAQGYRITRRDVAENYPEMDEGDPLAATLGPRLERE